MAEKAGGEVINMHDHPLIHKDEKTGYLWGRVSGIYVAMDPETRQPAEDTTLEAALARAQQASIDYRKYLEKSQLRESEEVSDGHSET